MDTASNHTSPTQTALSVLRQTLETRLDARPRPSATLNGDHDLNPGLQPDDQDRHIRDAAVLIPIIDRGTDPTVLLTKRTDHLNKHAGQISFPGGRLDDHDPGPTEAALRETEEEVGISPDQVDVVGYMQPYKTVTGYMVQPVIGLVTPDFTLAINPYEVAEAFEVPFAFLMDRANHKLHSRVYKGRTREFYAMPYNGYYIWGATAGMLRLLSERLYP